MQKPKDPRELVVKLLKRSSCNVQVAAVLGDKYGIFAWGTNHAGSNGFGCHAEEAAFRKANYKRVKRGAVLWVAARRRKSGSIVTSKPCAFCWTFASRCAYIVYRDKRGEWITMRGEL